jgi:glycosyltransferase involved in cell wall biosynthesis
MSQPKLGTFIEARCDALIANSYTSADLIKTFVSADLLHIIPNGIDLSSFAKIQHIQEPEKPIVGMVASLNSRSKNHELFIRAAMLVSKALPIEFRIYGHDPSNGGSTRGDAYVDRLYDLVNSSSLKQRFRWMGFVNQPEQIMSEIDILVHPTEKESFGRIAVEAMASGLPVVGVRGGGIGEIVQNDVTGFLAEPGDAAGLAASIERLARDPLLRKRMGCTGKALATEKYSLEACAQSVFQVYEQVLSKQSEQPHPSQPQATSA